MDDGWRGCGTCNATGAVDGEDCPRCLGECRVWVPVEDPYAAIVADDTRWALEKPRTPRDPAYLRWLRTQPCAFCNRPAPSEVSHHGRHGVGIKASDHLALPACHECHDRHHRTGSPHPGCDHMTPDERRDAFTVSASRYRARYERDHR